MSLSISLGRIWQKFLLQEYVPPENGGEHVMVRSGDHGWIIVFLLPHVHDVDLRFQREASSYHQCEFPKRN